VQLISNYIQPTEIIKPKDVTGKAESLSQSVSSFISTKPSEDVSQKLHDDAQWIDSGIKLTTVFTATDPTNNINTVDLADILKDGGEIECMYQVSRYYLACPLDRRTDEPLVQLHA
jgi:hypothetical protein